MTWAEDHRASEEFAAEAELAARRGDHLRAQQLYGEAAKAEHRALDAIGTTKPRTLGISAVSAVSLYFKANMLHVAEMLAYDCLGTKGLPSFALAQLRGLIQSIWSEQIREQAGIQFAPGQVIVSVRGQHIVEGGAPLDLIVDKVQTVQSLFFRTAELLRGLPHRKRGSPTKEIQDSCRPWLFQTVPGSYQFAVAVQEPKQTDFFPTVDLAPKRISDRFLGILRASVESPENHLPTLVPDPDYRATFLNLTRNLAPTGKFVDQLDVRAADERRMIRLNPDTRNSVTQVIRRSARSSDGQRQEKTIRGILRAVHLDKDWLEVSVKARRYRIDGAGDVVDDVIGPMVNRAVVVRIMEDARGKAHFRDIELDD